MKYLSGEQIKIDTPTLKKIVGQRVVYIGPGCVSARWVSPDYGTIR
jgi:hypothetical protein